MLRMDQKLDTVEKKLVQKRGMQGTRGGWKEFLNIYDKKFGSSLSDLSRRSHDALTSFLKTFTKEEDLKCLAKVMQCYLNYDLVEQSKTITPDDESPEKEIEKLRQEVKEKDFQIAMQDKIIAELIKNMKNTKNK